MPTNAPVAREIELTRGELLREIHELGFTSRYISGIFSDVSRPLSNFDRAAKVICSNKQLIREIFKSCPNIKPENFETLLIGTGDLCAAAIKKLHRRRKEIDFLMDKCGFSYTDIVRISGKSAGAVISGVDILNARRADLLDLIGCGFSADHVADILQGSHANLGKAIGELSRKKVLLFGLIRERRFTADELAGKLRGSGENVGKVFDADPDIRAALEASYRQLMQESPTIKRARFI